MTVQLTTIHKGHKFKTDVMFSASLFKMKDAYRSFSKYINYTLSLIEQLERIYPSASLRLYVDKNLTELERKQFFKDSVEVVEYYSEDFWQENSHEGVFGTFIRFIPMFDAKQKGTVIVCDVDIPDSQIHFLKELATHSPADTDLALVNATHKNPWMPTDNKFTIIAYGIVQFYRFPKRLLTQFLKGILSGKYRMNWEGRKNTGDNGRLPYGSDEWFMNNIVYTYLTTIHAKVHMITRDTTASSIKSIYYKLPENERGRYMATIKRLDTISPLIWTDPTSKKLTSVYGLIEKLYKDSLFHQYIQANRNKESIETFLRTGALVHRRTVEL